MRTHEGLVESEDDVSVVAAVGSLAAQPSSDWETTTLTTELAARPIRVRREMPVVGRLVGEKGDTLTARRLWTLPCYSVHCAAALLPDVGVLLSKHYSTNLR